MDKIGISHQEYVYPADMEKELFYQEFDRINVDSETDGILLLRPLPAFRGKGAGTPDRSS